MKTIVILMLLFAFGCCNKSLIKIGEPLPSPSPVGTPAVEYPVIGWHNDYDVWIGEGWDSLPNKHLFKEICPKGESVNYRSAWISYWKAIAKAESSFNRTSQYLENLGIDSVTKKQVKSEGLFQLSYQDEKGYPACDFDWESDKLKQERDATKTIFNPKKQFVCAMAIAAKLFTRYPNGHPAWGNPLGAYWSTARKGKNGEKYFRGYYPKCF